MAQMEIETSYKNRWASLTVTGMSLSGSDDRERKATVLHELVHILLTPIQTVEGLLDTCLVEDSAELKLAHETARDGIEAATEDICRAFLRVFKSASFPKAKWAGIHILLSEIAQVQRSDAREGYRVGGGWWSRWRESNPQPSVYRTVALPD